MRKCYKCWKEKPLDSFYKRRDGRSKGYRRECIKCWNKISSDSFKKNRDIRNQKSKIYYKNNSDRIKRTVKEYREKNKDKLAEKKRNSGYSKKYYIRTKRKHIERIAQRRANIFKSVPKWADLNAIKDVYLEAEYFGLEVDHIVPLKSPIVCGLHVWDNLQLLTKKENAIKGNRVWPEMP